MVKSRDQDLEEEEKQQLEDSSFHGPTAKCITESSVDDQKQDAAADGAKRRTIFFQLLL